MPGFDTAIQKLEFDKVLSRISHLALSEPGKSRALEITPSSNVSEIENELRRVQEAKELLILEGTVPFQDLRDITSSVKKCAIENSMLTGQELHRIGSILATSRIIRTFLGKHREQSQSLQIFQQELLIDKVVEYNISSAIDEQGNVRDGASKELRRIRSSIGEASESLKRKLESILKRISEHDVFQEDIITTRDGRMVIPVKTEFKRNVPGFIHSSSASGATTYIEPAESLELNNLMRELMLEEQREIERILKTLTQQVRDIRQPLMQSYEALVTLDVLFAKGRYSIEIIGSAPTIIQHPTIELVNARHPVLVLRHKREEVIPLNLNLDQKIKTLVITGPNAGGKSVAMKTVGLLVLCVQSGIHIPADESTQISIFKKLFVDIGDDQSIEQDLSTFSSHLTTLKEIISSADEKTLVLIDEIGAGTDPEEGGALAIAVLSELTQRSSFTVATTHLGMLKAFVHQSEHMLNGSMEFDHVHLRPTYRFIPGVPGSSYALELATRMGLSESIIYKAKGYLGEEKIQLEDLLLDISSRSQKYDKQLDLLTKERDALAKMIQSYESKMAESQREARTIRQDAKKEAENIVSDAKSKIENIIRNIREDNASKKTIQKSRMEIQTAIAELKKESGEEKAYIPQDFRIGDLVYLQGGSETGEITEIRNEIAVVTWKHGSIRVSMSTLRKADRKSETTHNGRSVFDTPFEVKNEIDLRGLTGDEAVQLVEKFLDDAFVAGLFKVSIIHGKGTGALRKRITELLRTLKNVKTFNLGEWNEGGSGVTVVELADK